MGTYFSETSHLSGDLTQSFTALLEKKIFLRSSMNLQSHSLWLLPTHGHKVSGIIIIKNTHASWDI